MGGQSTEPVQTLTLHLNWLETLSKFALERRFGLIAPRRGMQGVLTRLAQSILPVLREKICFGLALILACAHLMRYF